MALHEDSPRPAPTVAPRACTIDRAKLLAWLAAATLPWAIIFLAARSVTAVIH